MSGLHTIKKFLRLLFMMPHQIDGTNICKQKAQSANKKLFFKKKSFLNYSFSTNSSFKYSKVFNFVGIEL